MIVCLFKVICSWHAISMKDTRVSLLSQLQKQSSAGQWNTMTNTVGQYRSTSIFIFQRSNVVKVYHIVFKNILGQTITKKL